MLMNYVGLREGLRHLLDEAYTRGFDASGEGWNGEYPGDHLGRDQFKAKRKAQVDRMLSEIFPEKG